MLILQSSSSDGARISLEQNKHLFEYPGKFFGLRGPAAKKFTSGSKTHRDPLDSTLNRFFRQSNLYGLPSRTSVSSSSLYVE